MSILTLLRKMPILLVVPIERGYKNEDFATIQYYFISLLLGEGLKMLLPLPIPASVYGLMLMLLALCTGILKVEQVKDAAVFFD